MQATKDDTGYVKSDGTVFFPSMMEPSEGPKPTPNPDAPHERIGYAVVGLGRLSVQEIIPAIYKSKHSRLVALVSGSPEKAAVVGKQYGIAQENIYSYARYDEIKNNPNIQAVFIVLPNALHKEYVLRSAAAGKHILCEKPMAITVQDCKEMIDACEKAKVKLMIAYRMQYEPHQLEVIRRIRAGEIGKVKSIVAQNYQNSNSSIDAWRLRKAPAGGGSLPDIGIYCFNAARYFTGEEPTEVLALSHSTPGDKRFDEVEEAVYWTMRFPSGCIAQLSCSYGAHENKSVCITGEKARIVMDPCFPYHGVSVKMYKVNEKGVEEEITIDCGDVDQFAGEMDHFAVCIKKDIKPRTPGEEGMQDHVIMEAIYRSAAEGRPVPLPAHKGIDVFRGPQPKDE